MAEVSIVSGRYAYLHNSEWPCGVVDMHHILVKKSIARGVLTCLLAFILLAIALHLFLVKGKSTVMLLWSFLFCAILVKQMVWKCVVKESVVVIPALGVQLETHYMRGDGAATEERRAATEQGTVTALRAAADGEAEEAWRRFCGRGERRHGEGDSAREEDGGGGRENGDGGVVGSVWWWPVTFVVATVAVGDGASGGLRWCGSREGDGRERMMRRKREEWMGR
ncbi:hypothetical protein Tsubulata_048006 [Turnera subulata]|uniref:Uncharacterized protein n=1 Tax=Turnera subulata TaxID=218843 RepID=A0A9Q0G4J4_9ROSI|nr:hypothetical protein Tsubulata_048006 [Turnera subulata]